MLMIKKKKKRIFRDVVVAKWVLTRKIRTGWVGHFFFSTTITKKKKRGSAEVLFLRRLALNPSPLISVVTIAAPLTVFSFFVVVALSFLFWFNYCLLYKLDRSV